MPQAKDRELVAVSTPAHQHLRKIVEAYQALGLRTTRTSLLSELILAQPLPTNGRKSGRGKVSAGQGQMFAKE